MKAKEHLPIRLRGSERKRPIRTRRRGCVSSNGCWSAC